jgi:uncharacterized protein YuzE
MATTELSELKGMIPYFLKHKTVWSNYDEAADVLYLHFKKPNHADDTELLAENVLIRYEHDEIIGVTVMNASQNQAFN